MSVLRDTVISLLGALGVRWIMKKYVGPELPEMVVAERFIPQPLAVYHERIVWDLTPDCDPVKVRRARNFLNRNEDLVRRAYDAEVSPSRAAQQILDNNLINDESAIAPPIDWLLPKPPPPPEPPEPPGGELGADDTPY